MTAKILSKIAEIRKTSIAEMEAWRLHSGIHSEECVSLKEKLAVIKALEKVVKAIGENCAYPELLTQTLMLNHPKQKCANCETLESVWQGLERL